MYNITESDYSFVESNNVEFYGVRLLSGNGEMSYTYMERCL